MHVYVLVYELVMGDVPEDMAEKQSSIIPQSPVVVERINGGSKWLQDAVHDAGDETPHI